MTGHIINKNFMSGNHNFMKDFSKSSSFTKHHDLFMNFFVTYLKEMTIWMFSLNHTHHERWILVFIKDLLDLPFMYEDIYVFVKVILQ